MDAVVNISSAREGAERASAGVRARRTSRNALDREFCHLDGTGRDGTNATRLGLQ
ncbi:hypothetical protein N9S31_01345 [bacterium]|nr:hypothetical protein [bacterium]